MVVSVAYITRPWTAVIAGKKIHWLSACLQSAKQLGRVKAVMACSVAVRGLGFSFFFLSASISAYQRRRLLLLYMGVSKKPHGVQYSCTPGGAFEGRVHLCTLGYNKVPFMQFYVFPWASPSGIHRTALRVQIPRTLEAHGTTIT